MWCVLFFMFVPVNIVAPTWPGIPQDGLNTMKNAIVPGLRGNTFIIDPSTKERRAKKKNCFALKRRKQTKVCRSCSFLFCGLISPLRWALASTLPTYSRAEAR